MARRWSSPFASTFVRRASLLLAAIAGVLTLMPSPAQADPPDLCSQQASVYYGSDIAGNHAKQYRNGYFCLQSPDHTHFVIFQSDGNLVLYSTRGGKHATWSSRTEGRGATLSLQSDGNMVIYPARFDGFPPPAAVWNSGTFGARYADLLQVQNDGNLVLYRYPSTPRWSTGTVGR